MNERFLEFVNMRTREVSQRVNVTGRSEREVERCLRGMLINIGDEWYINDTADDESSPLPTTGDRAGEEGRGE